MSNYWFNRINKQNEINYNRKVKEVDKRIGKLYQTAAHSIMVDIVDLVSSLDKPVEEIKINDLYRNNQYYILLSKINKHLKKLGLKEAEIIDKEMIDIYNTTSALVQNELGFSVGFEDAAQEVVNHIWCPDGEHWSNRIWKNKAKMESILEQGLTDCLARGLSKDKLVSEMTRLTNAQRYQSERIVRTELTYIQNEACAKSYEKAGITQYKYISAHDDRVSEKCKKLNNQIFNFKDKKVGVNFPPSHANCRCTIIPVIPE